MPAPATLGLTETPLGLHAAVQVAAITLREAQTAQARDRERVMSDVTEFARLCWIDDPIDGPLAPEGTPDVPTWRMWDWQPYLLDLWAHERLVCVLKARQLGCSWLVAIYVLWVAMSKPSQRILLVSIGQREADKLLEKVAFILRRLPDWLRPMYRPGVRIIRFPALDSEIESLPSTGGIGRSRSASVVVLDEHAHQDNADDIYVAIEPTVQKGQLLSISTANGLGVLHTRLYKDAAMDANGYKAVFIPWSAHPDRDEVWLGQERARLSASAQPQLFAQEYPANDVEAFVATGSPVWTPEELERQPVERIAPVEPGLWVYRPPIEGERYVIGADTSEGLAASDWCSATVLRLTREADGYHAEQVAQLRGLWPPEVYAQKLDRLALRYCAFTPPHGYRAVLMGVERNNHGHAVLLRLRQLNQRDEVYALTYWGKALGWLTTSTTRPLMYDELAGAIREQHLVVRDPVTLSQMSTFHHTRSGGEAQTGYHDDDVTSLAIAWAHHRKAFGIVLEASKGSRAAA